VNRPSLRLRLALLSAALTGSGLMGFALLSGWLTYQAKLDRLDAQLLNGLMPLGRPRSGDRLINPELRLAQGLGLTSQEAVAILVIDRDGTRRYQSPWWPNLPPTQLGLDRPDPQLLPAPGQDRPQSRRLPRQRSALDAPTVGPVTWRTDQGRWRGVGRVTPLGRVAIAVSLQTLHQEMTALVRIYLITIPATLAAMAGGAWWLSGRALQPVNRLSQTITQVTAQGLHQRLPIAGADPEFETLITGFNAMLERLERSFNQASRFSGDAAHELKTPLAILQGELEQAIQQAEVGSPSQQTLSHLLDEVARLRNIVRKLLLLSLADAGQMGLRQEPVNLSPLVQEQLEDMPLLAPDLAVTAELDDTLMVMGDRDLLIQVIQNLLSNAVKYNLPQGWIRVQGHQRQGQVQLTVTNAANALTPAEQTHLFDRFYRGDPARTRTTEGLGLGLSLAREIARAHGGDVQLQDFSPHQVSLNLTLPVELA
jgi:two-component system, OmpR family, heavy metal sensor histidine kinase CusS